MAFKVKGVGFEIGVESEEGERFTFVISCAEAGSIALLQEPRWRDGGSLIQFSSAEGNADDGRTA